MSYFIFHDKVYDKSDSCLLRYLLLIILKILVYGMPLKVAFDGECVWDRYLNCLQVLIARRSPNSNLTQFDLTY